MPVKKFNPITPGTRFKIGNAYTEITTNKPEKSLLEVKQRTGGRNHTGKRSMRYIGGGHKQMYRLIDWKRDKHGVGCTVQTIEYDPNRSGFIALVMYADGERRYILSPNGLKVGDKLMSGPDAPPELGNALSLKDLPLGTIVHNVELHPGKGGMLVRSAGASAQLAAKEDKYAVLKMPSGEVRKILLTCMATVGMVSNPDHSLEVKGKAGANRWKGIKPRTRAVAMNPVDHPMGGGEGKASGGQPRSRTNVYSRGLKTRAPKNPSSKFIVSRRKK